MAGTTPTYALPYQTLDDPPDGPSLGEDLALAVEDELERIDAAAASLLAPGWTSYTPTWTATVTNPTLNNGTLKARYRRPAGSDLAIVQLHLTIGSTTNLGSGYWRFTLPVAAATGGDGYAAATGAAMLINNSGAESGYYAAAAWLQSSTTLAVVSSGAGGITNAVPFGWTAGDQVRLTFHYQPV